MPPKPRKRKLDLDDQTKASLLSPKLPSKPQKRKRDLDDQTYPLVPSPKMPSRSRKRKLDLDDQEPSTPSNGRLEVVRPRFWKPWSQPGKGKRRDTHAKETALELQGAYDGMVHLEGELTFSQQRRAFEYIFWPPLPRWCLVPFSNSANAIRSEDGELTPLQYGLGQRYGDQMWKVGVLGVFQPWRKYGQIFDHLLIPVHFPWQDDSTPEGEVPMFGLVHLRKDCKTAYLHVMTKWQQETYDKPEYNKLWAENLVQQLTSEQGIDQGLFSGDAAIKIEYVPNRVGPEWQNLGWRGRDMAELSKLSFYYIVYAATQLAVHGVHDTKIPQFGVQEVFIGLAQALLGVSTTLDNADEGKKSVRGGIRPRVGPDASDTLQAHRTWLDRVLPSVVGQYETAFSCG